MAGAVPPLRLANQPGETIPGSYRVRDGTGVSCAAASVQFARRDSRQADMGPFGAPDRTVTVPHRDRRAGTGLAGRHDGREKEQDRHGVPVTKVPAGSNSLTDDRNRPCAAPRNRALGERAGGRRARGPVGQPSPGKVGEPGALRGQAKRVTPVGASARSSDAALGLAPPDDQCL